MYNREHIHRSLHAAPTLSRRKVCTYGPGALLAKLAASRGGYFICFL